MPAMLEHNTKHTFRFGKTKLVFVRMSYESEFHVYAKALVYALYHKRYPTIKVEVKLEGRFQPDLNAEDYDGTMIFWAECGNVSINKVEKIFKKYRKAHFLFVKEASDIPLFEKQLAKMAKDFKSLPLVDILIFPEHFQEWNVSEEGDVYVNRDDVTVISWSDPGLRKKYF